MGDANSGGYNSTGKSASMPNYVPSSLPSGAAIDPQPDIQTVRVLYNVTQADVNNGVTARIQVNFPEGFADSNYTIGMAIEDLTGGGSNTNDYSPGDMHDLVPGGFNTVVYVGPGAASGEVIKIHVVAIHD